MDIPILKSVIILFAIAVVVILISKRLRVPVIIGYLLTGMVAGPHGLGLVNNLHEIDMLAEIGIILLLFSIGIEFSLQKFIRMKAMVLGGGMIQVVLTVCLVFLVAGVAGSRNNEAWFIGMLLALSSTAIVIRVIQESGAIDSPRGRTSLSILIFQDLAIIPMILVLPILAGKSSGSLNEIFILIIKVISVTTVVIVGARKLVPLTLLRVARTQSNELFLLTVIVIAFAVAWLTSLVGLSLALGAFMAGLIISESEFSEHALGNILPFISVFTSFFFISVGMLLDLRFLVTNIGLVLLVTTIVLMIKTLTGTIPVVMMGYPLRVALMTGITISQVGEFSFILSRMGVNEGILSAGNYQLFLSVSVLTMALTPMLANRAHYAADLIVKLPFPEWLKNGGRKEDIPYKDDEVSDHLIIVGYGINGRNVATAARKAGIRYRVLEMNPETVRVEALKGIPIAFGDATQEGVLKHAGIMRARVLVVTIAHPNGIRQITSLARRMNTGIHIIIRTRFIANIKPLFQLGANEVIPEEFETSIEIFVRVLIHYEVDQGKIDGMVSEIRANSYQFLRN